MVTASPSHAQFVGGKTTCAWRMKYSFGLKMGTVDTRLFRPSIIQVTKIMLFMGIYLSISIHKLLFHISSLFTFSGWHFQDFVRRGPDNGGSTEVGCPVCSGRNVGHIDCILGIFIVAWIQGWPHFRGPD